MRIALAQLAFDVGAIDANAERVLAQVRRARDELGCELVVFPELALSGYPPEDLLFHAGTRRRIDAALQRLVDEIHGIHVLVGFPEYFAGHIYNACALVSEGHFQVYRKQELPNYSVFDEKRYFTPGSEPVVAEVNGVCFGLQICEDIWEQAPSARARQAGAEVLLVINGSPYSLGSQARREEVMRRRVTENSLPMLYVNLVGGQDELVFDGGSAGVDRAGRVVFRAPAFAEDLYTVELTRAGDGAWDIAPAEVAPELPPEESIYTALVEGTRAYVQRNGFSGAIIGLSGGVDSALTLAIAVDALGAERVQCLLMPSRYTSPMSLEDAREQARMLGVRHDELSIEPLFSSALATLEPLFRGLPEDVTEENIQARCRGLLLMAVSNKSGRIVLTTGNKSEMAVGYATLYGDMAGGFAPLKDCSKTLVYRLARYRNTLAAAIPERVLTREPTAELRADQRDSDSLPPYDVLDAILEAFIEEDLSVEEIVARGFEHETVSRVLSLVQRAEYKRRQAPPGVRVSRRAFGRDWRYPITSGY